MALVWDTLPVSEWEAMTAEEWEEIRMADQFWVGVDTSWETATNWENTNGGGEDSGPPIAGDLVIFDGDPDQSVVLDVITATAVLGSFDMQAGYSGDFDCDTKNLLVTGDITLAGSGTFDLGTGTHMFTDCDFDMASQGTVTVGTSTATFVGACSMTSDAGLANRFASLTIASGTTTLATALLASGTITIDGILDTNGKSFFNLNPETVVGASGKLTGTGKYQINTSSGGGGLHPVAGAVVDVAVLEIENPINTVTDPLSPFTYGCASVVIQSTASGREFNFSATPSTPYVFSGNLLFEVTGAGDELTVDLSTDPTITVAGDLAFTETAGTLTITLGTIPISVAGDVTISNAANMVWTSGANDDLLLNGADAQVIDVDSVDIGEVTITKSVGNVFLEDEGGGGSLILGAIDMDAGNLTLAAGGANSVSFTSTADAKNITGNVTFASAGTANLGAATWTFTDCAFDYSVQDTFTRGTSTVVFAGISTLTAGSDRLTNVTIAANATLTATENSSADTLLTVNGILSINTTKTWTSATNTARIVLGADAQITGAGTFSVATPGVDEGIPTVPAGATIDVAALIVTNPEVACLAPLGAGSYASAAVSVSATAAAKVMNFAAGAYEFTGATGLTFVTSGSGALTVDLATNNPTITVVGDLSLTETAGTLTFTHGTVPIEVLGSILFADSGNLDYTAGVNGDFVMSGSGDVSLDTDGVTIGEVAINKPTDGNVSIGSGSATTFELAAVDMASSGSTEFFSFASGTLTATSDAKVFGGAVTFAAGTVNMGSATWTIGGNFNYAAVTTLNDDTSTIVMTGGTVGTPVNLTGKSNVQLKDVTIAADAFVDQTGGGSTVLYSGSLLVNGTLDIASGKIALCATTDSRITLGTNGTLSGAGALTVGTSGVNEGIASFPVTATVSIATIVVDLPEAECLAPLGAGAYDSAQVTIQSNAAGKQHNFEAGAYSFAGNMTILTTGGELIVDCVTNDPAILIQGDFTLTQTAGNIVFTHGDNPITVWGDITCNADLDTDYTASPGGADFALDGTATQLIDMADTPMGNITANKATGDLAIGSISACDLTLSGVTLTDGSLTIGAGNTIGSNVAAKNISGDVTFGASTVSLGTGITWTIGGDFDYSGVGTLNDDTSTVVMTGGTSGSPVALTGKNNVQLKNVTIAADAFVKQTGGGTQILLAGDSTFNGSLEIDTGKVYSTSSAGASVVFSVGGAVTGAGNLVIVEPGSGNGLTAYPVGATVTCGILDLRYFSSGAVFKAGTYAPTTRVRIFSASAGNKTTLDTLTGDYVFDTDVLIETAADAGADTIIDNSIGNPNISISGAFTFTLGAGSSITYTKGTGTLTAIAPGGTWTTLTKDLEAIVVASGATLTQADALACDGLILQSGATLAGAFGITTANGGDLLIRAGAAVTKADLDTLDWDVDGDCQLLGRGGPLVNKLDLEIANNLTITVTGANTLTARNCIMENVIADDVRGVGVNCFEADGTPLEGTDVNGNIGWDFTVSAGGGANTLLFGLGMAMGNAPG